MTGRATMHYAPLSKLRRRWQWALENHRQRRELQACPPAELARIASDIGFTNSDLRSLNAGHPGPRELMPDRLEQLGLDPAYLKEAQTATYRDMERVCATCRDWRRCGRDLAAGDVEAGMRNYCLNAPTIDALIVARPGKPRH